MARSSTTYPKKWLSGKTTVIRVPEAFAGSLVQVAEKMDGNPGFLVKERGLDLLLEPITAPKKVRYVVGKPINVSCVPQRSPFRYPGGKTWLVPYIRDWLKSLETAPALLVEPFAGGGIVSLTAGFEGLAQHVVFSEVDPQVSSVWTAILNGHSDWLAEQILQFDLTPDTAKAELAKLPRDEAHLAFQTILRNRVQRGGILAPGAGLVKTGENGRGIRSRWYPETLARRIREIHAMKKHFTFIQGDAFDVIRKYQRNPRAAFYIDPPYTVAGRRLYRSWDVNHEALFAETAKCRGDFLMSYDNTEEIQSMALRYGFDTREIAMKSTHHAQKTELLIGRDLSWMDSQED